jgi:hypothetical protein
LEGDNRQDDASHDGGAEIALRSSWREALDASAL